MPAYVLARVEVTNAQQYKKYVEASSGIAANFGGKFIARGGQSVVLEGPAETRRLVVIEFPSLKLAQDWYHSPEYQNAKTFRVDAAVAEFLALEGV